MLLSKNTFKLYSQQMICYTILHLSHLAIETMLYSVSPSEMYHDIFQKEKNYEFLETIDIKGTAEKFYMYTYLILTLFMWF